MEITERHIGDSASGTFFDCADGYFNLRNMLFSGKSFQNEISHQFIYGLLKLHVHEDSL